MKRICAAVLLSVFVTAAHAAAPQWPSQDYVGVMANFMVAPDSGRLPDLDGGLGVHAVYGMGQDMMGLPLEYYAFYDMLKAKGGGSDPFRAGLGADVLYPFLDIAGMTLFGVGGGGLIYSDAVPSGDAEFNAMASIGAGLLTSPLFLDDWRVRGELRYAWENLEGGYMDVHARVGVEIPLGASAAPTSEPKARVVRTETPPPPPAPAVDADGDGVIDARDQCPDTPAEQQVDAAGCTVAKILALRGVTFELGSDQLRPESLAVLDETASTLKSGYSGTHVEVAGHTDSSGDDSYNEDLSRRRANTVREYLISQGVDGGNLSAAGYGESQPVSDNDSIEGRKQNRRVELRVREK